MLKKTKENICNWIANVFYDGNKELAQKFMYKFTFDDKTEYYKQKGGTSYLKFIDFRDARYELLNICYKSKDPHRRWERYKGYIISNLNKLRLDFEKERELTPRQFISRLLSKNTVTRELFTFVASSNALSSKPVIKLPEDVELSSTEEELRHWTLIQKTAKITVLYNDKEVKSYNIPYADYKNFETTYFLFESGNEKHTISQHEFYLRYKEEYPDFAKTYKLDKDTNPSVILHRTSNPEKHKEILNVIIGTPGEWRRKFAYTDVDIYEVLNKYEESRTPNEVVKFYKDINPIWNPDNNLIDIAALRAKLIDSYLYNINIADREKILVGLFHRLDFELFDVKSFREIFLSWKLNNKYDNIRLFSRELENKYSPTNNKISESDRKYWNIYLDVEHYVKSRNWSKRKACQYLQQKYNLGTETIWTRYKEKQSMVKKNNLTDKEIIQLAGHYL